MYYTDDASSPTCAMWTKDMCTKIEGLIKYPDHTDYHISDDEKHSAKRTKIVKKDTNVSKIEEYKLLLKEKNELISVVDKATTRLTTVLKKIAALGAELGKDVTSKDLSIACGEQEGAEPSHMTAVHVDPMVLEAAQESHQQTLKPNMADAELVFTMGSNKIQELKDQKTKTFEAAACDALLSCASIMEENNDIHHVNDADIDRISRLPYSFSEVNDNIQLFSIGLSRSQSCANFVEAYPQVTEYLVTDPSCALIVEENIINDAKIVDIPSFSIGLTQSCADVVKARPQIAEYPENGDRSGVTHLHCVLENDNGHDAEIDRTPRPTVNFSEVNDEIPLLSIGLAESYANFVKAHTKIAEYPDISNRFGCDGHANNEMALAEAYFNEEEEEMWRYNRKFPRAMMDEVLNSPCANQAPEAYVNEEEEEMSQFLWSLSDPTVLVVNDGYEKLELGFLLGIKGNGWVTSQYVTVFCNYLNYASLNPPPFKDKGCVLKRPTKAWFPPSMLWQQKETFRSKRPLLVDMITGSHPHMKNIVLELDAVQMFFFPCVSKKHWRLFIVNMPMRKLQYLDSLGSHGYNKVEKDGSYCLKTVNDYFLSMKMAKNVTDFELSLEPCPLQDDMYSCGVIVCKLMQLWEGHAKPEWNINWKRPEVLSNFRKQMCANVVLYDGNNLATSWRSALTSARVCRR